MIVTTFFTGTHEGLFKEHFLPSLVLGPGDLMVAVRGNDLCASGDFNSEGFNAVMVEKMRHLAWCANKFDGELILFAEADIRFYSRELRKAVVLALGNNLIAFQQDGANEGPPVCCTGLFAFHACRTLVDFFDSVGRLVPERMQEQDAANELLLKPEWRHVKYGFMPETWWTHGREHGFWEGVEAQVFNVPPDIVAHHANWTIGVGNKSRLLESVRRQLKS